jgi:hypothetical protein
MSLVICRSDKDFTTSFSFTFCCVTSSLSQQAQNTLAAVRLERNSHEVPENSGNENLSASMANFTLAAEMRSIKLAKKEKEMNHNWYIS